VLPADNSALQWAPVGSGVTDDPARAIKPDGRLPDEIRPFQTAPKKENCLRKNIYIIEFLWIRCRFMYL
jgi:hypothetical protein